MDESQQSSLRDYLRIVFRYKVMIVTLVIVTVLTVNIGIEMKTPRYQASVKMYVKGLKETEAKYYRGIAGGSIFTSHGELLTSSVVIDRVVKALKLYQRPLDYEKRFASKLKAALIDYKFNKQFAEINKMPPKEKEAVYYNAAFDNLRSNLSAGVSEESTVFYINVIDYNPNMAAVIANSVSRSYVIFDLEQQILELEIKFGEKNATVIQLQNYIKEFENYLDGSPLPALDAIGPASVKIIEQAKPGILIPNRPSNFVARLLSFIMSLSVGILLAFGLDYLDHTIKSPKDIESFLHIKFLGSIPNSKKRKLLLPGSGRSDLSDVRSYRTLSQKLIALARERGQKTILLTDAENHTDNSSVVAKIAQHMFLEEKLKVLLIDAGLRNPSVNHLLNVPASPGLADVIEGKIPFEFAVQIIDSGFHVLTAGSEVSNISSTLGSSKMAEIINSVKGQYDIVFVTSGNIVNYTDSLIVASIVDGVVLVFNEGKVKRQVIRHALVPLQDNKVNILGAIINNRRYVIPEPVYKIS